MTVRVVLPLLFVRSMRQVFPLSLTFVNIIVLLCVVLRLIVPRRSPLVIVPVPFEAVHVPVSVVNGIAVVGVSGVVGLSGTFGVIILLILNL